MHNKPKTMSAKAFEDFICAESLKKCGKAPKQVRVHSARAARDFILAHPEYTTKEEAYAAFKAEQERLHSTVSANGLFGAAPDDQMQVVGFGILTQIFVGLLLFFFERWWARTHPNV